MYCLPYAMTASRTNKAKPGQRLRRRPSETRTLGCVTIYELKNGNGEVMSR
jgi:hypothetical protein